MGEYSSIQNARTRSTVINQAFDLFQNREVLNQCQQQLLVDIDEKFTTRDDQADMAILYEITGYKDQQQDEFWYEFGDFKAEEQEDIDQ